VADRSGQVAGAGRAVPVRGVHPVVHLLHLAHGPLGTDQFGVDLVNPCHEVRPNPFVNNPDILHVSLQHGGPAMFALRAALAATMSPSWGVYSGYEFYDHEPVGGSEEYLDSETYQLRPRDYAKALADGRSLEPWLTRLNAIRRAHPALQQLRTLHFHGVGNESIIAYSKTSGSDTVIMVLILDSDQPQEGTLWLDLPALGFGWADRSPCATR
jgi:starch synthase (maltosyl-transferring)